MPVILETKEEDDFQVNPKYLRSLITDKTKALILSYPNNPTGAIAYLDNLEEIAEIVKEHNLILISDEIYHKLIYNEKHICISSLKNMKNRTILLNGFSKSYAMTGWRIGFSASSKYITEGMTKIHQYTMLCAPITAQKAAIEALKNGDKEVEKMVEEYERRRNFAISSLNDIGLDCFEPKGAFYLFPKIQRTGLSSEEFSEKLLREEKVAVVPGSAFGDCGEGYIRISYTTSRENLKEALKRIERFVKGLNKVKNYKHR